LLAAVSLYCCYQFGKILENYWGTLRFNLYYLVGLLMTDLAALLMGYPATASALNLSLFLAVATIAPDLRVYLMFILPLKLKYLAWVYLGVTAWNVVQMLLSYSVLRFYWLMPLVPLANYFLFFGRDFLNLFPDSWRRPHRNYRTTAGPRPNANWAPITAPNPAKSPIGTSARSAAGRIRTIPISSSAIAQSAMATTAIASTISITTYTFNDTRPPLPRGSCLRSTQTGSFETILFFLREKEKNGFNLPRKERGQGAYRCPDLTQKISAISCPLRSSLPPERSLHSAHRLSVQLHSKTNAFGPMRASAPTRKFQKIGRTICPPKFFLPFFDAICYNVKL
ncbi:MAG: hypothetical protein V8T01_02260, partial [Oscillospiraceae bacterium]